MRVRLKILSKLHEPLGECILKEFQIRSRVVIPEASIRVLNSYITEEITNLYIVAWRGRKNRAHDTTLKTEAILYLLHDARINSKQLYLMQHDCATQHLRKSYAFRFSIPY